MWQIVDEQDKILHSGYINRFSKGPGQIYVETGPQRMHEVWTGTRGLGYYVLVAAAPPHSSATKMTLVLTDL